MALQTKPHDKVCLCFRAIFIELPLPAGRLLLHIHDQDLTSLNTLGLRSQAKALVRYSTAGQLPQLTELAARYDKVMVLGGGSNVVLAPVLNLLVGKVESRSEERRVGNKWVSTC